MKLTSAPLQFPAEKFPTERSLTNRKCLDEARRFFTYADVEGFRGSPHRHSERLSRIDATDVVRRLRAGHRCAKRDDDNYDPARQSRAIHLKTNFQLDKQAVRY